MTGVRKGTRREGENRTHARRAWGERGTRRERKGKETLFPSLPRFPHFVWAPNSRLPRQEGMEYFVWDRLFVWVPEYKQACNYLLFLFSCIFQFFNFHTQLWVLFYKKRDKRNINIPSIHLKTCNIVPWLFLRCFYYSPTFIRAVRKYSARAKIPPLNLFFICNFRIFSLEYYYIIGLSYFCPDDNHFWLFIISLCYLLWQHTRFLGNKFSVIYKIPSVSLSLSLSVRFVCLLLPSLP